VKTTHPCWGGLRSGHYSTSVVLERNQKNLLGQEGKGKRLNTRRPAEWAACTLKPASNGAQKKKDGSPHSVGTDPSAANRFKEGQGRRVAKVPRMGPIALTKAQGNSRHPKKHCRPALAVWEGNKKPEEKKNNRLGRCASTILCPNATLTEKPEMDLKKKKTPRGARPGRGAPKVPKGGKRVEKPSASWKNPPWNHVKIRRFFQTARPGKTN